MRGSVESDCIAEDGASEALRIWIADGRPWISLPPLYDGLHERLREDITLHAVPLDN